MGQKLSILKVRGIPHSQSEFQEECCLKFLVLSRQTFLNYCRILFSVLDKCTLALFTACLECYCKDNFPIHHLEPVTHLCSPPLATSSPLLRHKLLLFAFVALHNFSPFYWTSPEQHDRTASRLWTARTACFCSLPDSFPNVVVLSPILISKTDSAVKTSCKGNTRVCQTQSPCPEPSTATGTHTLQLLHSLFTLCVILLVHKLNTLNHQPCKSKPSSLL